MDDIEKVIRSNKVLDNQYGDDYLEKFGDNNEILKYNSDQKNKLIVKKKSRSCKFKSFNHFLINIYF